MQAEDAGKITRRRISHSQHTPSYTYAIYNRQALHLLEQLQPYVKGYKARRSALILRDYVALVPRNGKYSEEQLRNRILFEKAALSITPRPDMGEADEPKIP